jgi:hypothetical protein
LAVFLHEEPKNTIKIFSKTRRRLTGSKSSIIG